MTNCLSANERQRRAFLQGGVASLLFRSDHRVFWNATPTDRYRSLVVDAPKIRHIKANYVNLIDDAFLYGYCCNIVGIDADGAVLHTLTPGCMDAHGFKGSLQTSFSVWTRDLYWGFLGWAQAADDSALNLMRSSLQLLIRAKNKNQALGQNSQWPLNDKRFYIPEAYVYRMNAESQNDLSVATRFYPWCSESQADFLLLAYDYWKLSGDHLYIESIWEDIAYVTTTLELLDTNGNSLPDALEGSYDYQSIGLNTEEPLMCAKTSMAYKCVAELARILGKDQYAERLSTLARKVKETMNKPTADGGLWESSLGHYVTRRGDEIVSSFIPYDNLVPMWSEMTSEAQEQSIFDLLDKNFEQYYELSYGPIYCAPAAHTEKSMMPCSSVPWLGFLDVYLRGKKKREKNRRRIFDLLMRHADDAGGIPFAEGAGIYGTLTGGAGRAWDNGNFFHMLICGVFGIEKSKDGITLTAPEPVAGIPVKEIKDIFWRDAVYSFRWHGDGETISRVLVDGVSVTRSFDSYMIKGTTGTHQVNIFLTL